MKKIFFLKIQLVFVFGLLLLNTSCALKPIPSEYAFVASDSKTIALEALGNGKVLVYNAAGALHQIDNTARLNVWIDDKPAGQIRANEYVVFELPEGKHKFDLVHIDMVKMKSTHQFNVKPNTKVIRIKPTLNSNNLEITNAFPENFSRFKHSIKR